jgi:hypothetical protein
MAYLSSKQRARVEQLARDKEVSCQVCGSTDLSSDDDASHHFDGANVNLWCNNEVAHPDGAKEQLRLTLDEARWVGIDMEPRDLNETGF